MTATGFGSSATAIVYGCLPATAMDWTNRYPLISAAARKLKAPFFVIDGEAVWLDLMANLDLNQRTDLDRTTM
jgi:hypothetical protein